MTRRGSQCGFRRMARHLQTVLLTQSPPAAYSSHPSRYLRLLAFLLVAALIFVPGGWAQIQDEVHVQPHAKPSDSALEAKSSDPALKTHTKPMRVDVDLVLIPATITDPMNRLVTGLERDNFELFENGEKQEIRHFSSEDAPLSLGVIFDMSGSMSNKIEKAREAVVEFFRTANPQDEFFMIAFSERPELLSDFTSLGGRHPGQADYHHSARAAPLCWTRFTWA